MKREPTKSSGVLPLSDRVRRGELFTVDCPSRDVLKNVCSLWGVLCLIALQDGILRYGEIRRKATGISEKMLAQTLKRLEGDGFVKRTSYPVVPPIVEYELTSLGLEMAAQISGLTDWIELNLWRVMEARGLESNERVDQARG